ncbi:MAG: hypothetical protein U1C04_24795 [Hydrogenophaga sp.]|uniref:hypothetical protein n=1 Tax=Hydrogenophaga sp. TaxID=1904254 RepID=UPI002AB8AA31|nr:hypothetical protein [Hydrogenophaga sp.]MDZ4283966.1 hypothetical protein [Hydrogenophaga sp.]
MNGTKRLRAHWFPLALAWALTGCSGGGNAGSAPALTPQEHVAQLEASGALPKLERTDTIAGIDANANGVRDDIEQYIEKKYSVPAERAAAMQTARALQQTILLDTNDAVKLEEVSKAGMRAAKCRGLVFPGMERFSEAYAMSRDIEAMTTNTKDRLLIYIAYNKAVSGTVSQLPEGDSCE